MKEKFNLNNKHICIKYSIASVTVEAALIIPIILSVIFTLLYISFIEHDKALLRIEMDKRIETECRSYANGCDKWDNDNIKNDFLEYASKHLFLYNVQYVKCSNNGITATLEVRADTRISNVLINRLTSLKTIYSEESMRIIQDYCSEKRISEVIPK